MKSLLLWVVATVVVVGEVRAEQQVLASRDLGLQMDEEIRHINNVQSSWKAGRNFHPDKVFAVQKRVAVNTGVHESVEDTLTVKETPGVTDLPDNFDAREKWPLCHTLGQIHDQGNCASGWAMAAVEAMSDRFCIAEGNTLSLSAQHLMSCCQTCGNGCDGGFPSAAWSYFVTHGVVTGGDYQSLQGCQPYLIPGCDHDVDMEGSLSPCKGRARTPACEKQCRAGYDIEFDKDKHYGLRYYNVQGERAIMEELYTRGPVQATFTVYTDFLHYKSGVYGHTSGTALGIHSVKILGYGIENGDKYWLAANSWNHEWGDEGFFKILRGRDECGIEGQVVAGDPKI